MCVEGYGGCYRTNIAQGGGGHLSFKLWHGKATAGVVVNILEGLPCIALDRFQTSPSNSIHIHTANLSLHTQKYLHIVDSTPDTQPNIRKFSTF